MCNTVCVCVAHASAPTLLWASAPQEVFRVLGAVLIVLLALMWLVVMCRTLWGAWTGKLFHAPCLKQLPLQQQQAAPPGQQARRDAAAQHVGQLLDAKGGTAAQGQCVAGGDASNEGRKAAREQPGGEGEECAGAEVCTDVFLVPVGAPECSPAPEGHVALDVSGIVAPAGHDASS